MRPVRSTAWSWQPPHHFDGFVPTTSCMYSIDLRYHWLLNDEKWCIEDSHWAVMSGWQPGLPPGHHRPVGVLDAPFLVVQQPVVPQVDRVHAGGRRNEAVEMVRRVPRPGGAPDRQNGHADRGADRHATGAGGYRLPGLSLDRGGEGHHGSGRVPPGIPADAPLGREPEPHA